MAYQRQNFVLVKPIWCQMRKFNLLSQSVGSANIPLPDQNQWHTMLYQFFHYNSQPQRLDLVTAFAYDDLSKIEIYRLV